MEQDEAQKLALESGIRVCGVLPRNFVMPNMFVELVDRIYNWLIKAQHLNTKDMQPMTLEDKIALIAGLTAEIKAVLDAPLKDQASSNASGGSNPPGPGQPGQP
jgi:hypothetical protein